MCAYHWSSCFFNTKLNFHYSYLDTYWDICTVAFLCVDVLVIANISFDGMMGKLQSSYPEHHDELVEIMGININWIIHQLSVWQRRDEKSQV